MSETDVAKVQGLWTETYAGDLAGRLAPGDTFSGGLRASPNAIAVSLDAPTITGDLEEDGTSVSVETDSLTGYELRERVGSGGMGEVWSAEQRVLRREVAVKVNKRPENALSRAIFISEATVTAHLSHPNIVPVYDLMVDADSNAFAMKRIQGRSWGDVIASDMARLNDEEWGGLYRTADFEKHLKIFFSVCDAVAFAHDQGILHNDLKPANVMVGEFGEVLLLDWGLALDCSPNKKNDFMRHITSLQRPFGTPEFISPEVARGQGSEMGPWCDVYGLGAILFYLIEGYSPHDGEDTLEIIKNVVSGERIAFSPEVDEHLADICDNSLQLDRGRRTQSALELKRSLEGYLKTRQSRLLASVAKNLLAECADLKLAATDAEDATEHHNRIYALYVEAYSTFRQASRLSLENDEAKEGELQAHHQLALWALEQGDLGVAEAQIPALGRDLGLKDEVLLKLATAKALKDKAIKRARLLRNSSILMAILVAVGVFVSFSLIQEERQIAQDHADLATSRFENIRRLSDIELLNQYRTEAERLWPALPKHVTAMQTWISNVQELVARKDGHLSYLETFCTDKGRRTPEGECVFLSHVDTWEYQTFQALEKDIRELGEVGLRDMTSRLEFASEVKKRTIDDLESLWRTTTKDIAAISAYSGLNLSPQLGLVPLGPDPKTGLHEFAHLQSGDVPKRGVDGRLQLTEETGIVLVLVPGGSFTMGAMKPSETAPLGSPNVDPETKKSEGPPHNVKLEPFFMGKYELTQGQWQRFTKDNPAAYAPGRIIGGNTHDARHPVEQIGWKDTSLVLERLDLVLPTETQWEYAIRAGTQTIYWTGDAKESLQGAANLSDLYCHENEGPKSWRYEAWLNDGYTVHAPVGSYRANSFGLHDMAGNVWEWVRDRQSSYDQPMREGDGLREGGDDAPRIFRGGGFRATTIHARSAERYGLYAPDYTAYDVGARASRPIKGY